MGKSMAEVPKGKAINLSVDGHPVKISFANEYNAGISQLIKNALIDDFLRKNGFLETKNG